MLHRPFYLSAALIAVVASQIVSGLVHAKETRDRPNIIFILTDDLGYGDLGVLFQKDRDGVQLKTPALDQMAAEGTILNRHYCPAPICAPSRGSLITGMHQGHANVRNMQFDKAVEDNHNFANTLQAAGYHTMHIGKYGLQGWGHSPEKWAGYPTKRGFDYYYGYVRHVDGHQHYPANRWELGSNESKKETKEMWENDQEVSAGLDKCYTTDLWTARAKQLIIEQATEHPTRPFFMFLSYDTPHAALQLPTVPYPEGQGIDGGIQWLGQAGRMINTATGIIDSYRDPLYTDKELTDVAERFATSVTRIDYAVGDLLQTIKDLKIADTTVVVFTSDNGPHAESYITGQGYNPSAFQSAGHFKGRKGNSWEGGLRVPTLAWGSSRVLAGHLSNTPSQFHDWMATFCDLAGMEPPARTDGVSLLPTLSGVGEQQPGKVYVEFNNHHVVYHEGYKGIRTKTTDHSVDFEIYDTLKDGPEANNLAETSAYFQALQQRMKDRVLQMRMPNPSAKRSYDNELVPALNLKENSLMPGVLAHGFQGTWNWVPEFTAMAPELRALGKGIDLEHLPAEHDAGLLLTGNLSVPEDGTWTFYGEAAGHFILKIHDMLVLDGDYKYAGTVIEQRVNLESGFHPFRLYYKTGSGAPTLNLKWEGPGTSKSDLDPKLLYIDKSTAPE